MQVLTFTERAKCIQQLQMVLFDAGEPTLLPQFVIVNAISTYLIMQSYLNIQVIPSPHETQVCKNQPTTYS